MHRVTIEEAKTHLHELMDEIQRGEEVVILCDNVPAARLVPATRAGFGSYQGQIVMAEDFDAPLDDFAGYTP